MRALKGEQVQHKNVLLFFTYTLRAGHCNAKSVHAYKSCATLAMLPRTVTADMPRAPYVQGAGRQNRHSGQLKLMLGELEFLVDYFCSCADAVHAMHNTLIVYAGAAPGEHILDLLDHLPRTHWHLYDPAPFAPQLRAHARVRAFNTEFTDEHARAYRSTRTLLISDIRSAVPDRSQHHSQAAKDADDMRVEAGVARDMAMQERWVHLMQPVRASLKFRPPYNYPFCPAKPLRCLAGAVTLQAFAPANSTETRLIVSARDTQELDCAAYEEQLAHFNQVLRPLGYDYACRDAIMQKLHAYQRSLPPLRGSAPPPASFVRTLPAPRARRARTTPPPRPPRSSSRCPDPTAACPQTRASDDCNPGTRARA